MKRILITAFLLLPLFTMAQTYIVFSSFEEWSFDGFKGESDFVKKYYSKGYVEVDKEKQRVVVFNKTFNTGQVRHYNAFEKTNDGYRSYGIDNPLESFNFSYEHKLLILRYNDTEVFKFQLTNNDVIDLLFEFNKP